MHAICKKRGKAISKEILCSTRSAHREVALAASLVRIWRSMLGELIFPRREKRHNTAMHVYIRARTWQAIGRYSLLDPPTHSHDPLPYN